MKQGTRPRPCPLGSPRLGGDTDNRPLQCSEASHTSPCSLKSSYSLIGLLVYCPSPHKNISPIELVLRVVHIVILTPKPRATLGSQCAASKCLLSTYYIPDIILGTQETSVNKTGKAPALLDCPFQGRINSGRDSREESFWNARQAAGTSSEVSPVTSGLMVLSLGPEFRYSGPAGIEKVQVPGPAFAAFQTSSSPPPWL